MIIPVNGTLRISSDVNSWHVQKKSNNGWGNIANFNSLASALQRLETEGASNEELAIGRKIAQGVITAWPRIPALKAIREYCLQCQGGYKDFVRDCAANETCALWHFRMRKRGIGGISPTKAIRKNCFECSAHEAPTARIRKCKALSCPVWPFRFGKNPWLSEKRRILAENRGKKMAI